MSARLLACLVAVLALGCDREERAFRSLPPAQAIELRRASPLVPGPPQRVVTVRNPYQANAWGIAQGEKLFSWFNCVGCHSHGGGGMGPPLMDEKWLYGGRPEDIYASIAEGRPNGMPSFAGLVPPDQIWQLVAHVQELSGRVRMDAASGRADAMQVGEPELMRERAAPEGESRPR